MKLVIVRPGARRAYGLPPALPRDAIVIADDGTTLRIRADGGADPWPPMFHKSIASDPTATAHPKRRRSAT